METQRLHRGRLIDHLQLVVEDFAASRRFYAAVFAALEVPPGGEGEDYFWYDELFVSSRESAAAQGALTGRTHLAFQAGSRELVDRFHRAALAAGGGQWRAGRAAVPSRILRGLRAGSGRQQRRSRVSRTGAALGRVGRDHVRILKRAW